MIVVKLTGGLGNQMFQYAMGRKLAHKYNCELYLDKSGYRSYKIHNYELDRFDIIENYETKTSRLITTTLGKLKLKPPVPTVKEESFNYSDAVFSFKPPFVIDGYWQSERYFSDIRNLLVEEFSLRQNPTSENLEWLRLIQSGASVSLHIRRGDYLTNQSANAFHGILPLSYYSNAISKIREFEKELTFFIFSDDPEWVSKNLKLEGKSYYISNNQNKGYEDLRLMSHCKYNVIANSSFSWWGAWLNENTDKKVYAPNRWFKDTSVNTTDVIPANWMQVPIE